jgi:hypothetical protein
MARRCNSMGSPGPSLAATWGKFCHPDSSCDTIQACTTQHALLLARLAAGCPGTPAPCCSGIPCGTSCTMLAHGYPMWPLSQSLGQSHVTSTFLHGRPTRGVLPHAVHGANFAIPRGVPRGMKYTDTHRCLNNRPPTSPACHELLQECAASNNGSTSAGQAAVEQELHNHAKLCDAFTMHCNLQLQLGALRHGIVQQCAHAYMCTHCSWVCTHAAIKAADTPCCSLILAQYAPPGGVGSLDLDNDVHQSYLNSPRS